MVKLYNRWIRCFDLYGRRIRPSNFSGEIALRPASAAVAPVASNPSAGETQNPQKRVCVSHEPADGFEPPTYCLQNSCSTTELCRRIVFFIFVLILILFWLYFFLFSVFLFFKLFLVCFCFYLFFFVL